jgi:hypothetical protein
MSAWGCPLFLFLFFTLGWLHSPAGPQTPPAIEHEHKQTHTHVQNKKINLKKKRKKQERKKKGAILYSCWLLLLLLFLLFFLSSFRYILLDTYIRRLHSSTFTPGKKK